MLCQKCKKNNAVIYYKENVNGRLNEYALCSDCAHELEQNGTVKLTNPISSSFDDLFGMGSLFSGLFGGGSLRSDAKRCPLCGSRFDELAHNGRLGCPMCYEVFASELAPTISQLHGAVKQSGRSPRRFGERQERVRQIEQLRGELEGAVKAQEFERAVVLRDKLRELEAVDAKPTTSASIENTAANETEERK